MQGKEKTHAARTHLVDSLQCSQGRIPRLEQFPNLRISQAELGEDALPGLLERRTGRGVHYCHHVRGLGVHGAGRRAHEAAHSQPLHLANSWAQLPQQVLVVRLCLRCTAFAKRTWHKLPIAQQGYDGHSRCHR